MPNYESIEDFDEEQEEKLLKNQEKNKSEEEEEEVDQTDEETLTEDELDDEEENDEEELKEEDEQEETKEKDEKDSSLAGDEHLEKEKFAFAELRRKAKDAEKKAREKDTSLKEFDELAKDLGYKNHAELLKAQREKMTEEKVKKEASQKGVDPDVYRELVQLKEKLGDFEKEKIQVKRQQKIEKFTRSLDKVSTDYSLKQEDREQILGEMENDGYNVEDLYEIKNPERFILGYMTEKVAEKKVQEKLSSKGKEKFKEEPFKKQKSNKKSVKDLQDKLIKKEMKQYAEDEGLET